MKLFWKNILATFFHWKNTAFVTSTIVEIDYVTGKIVKIPGAFPEKERSFFFRSFASWKRTDLYHTWLEFKMIRRAHISMLNRNRWGVCTDWTLLASNLEKPNKSPIKSNLDVK